MSASQRKSLAKRFSKHDSLERLVKWYVCPSFSANVPAAEFQQGLKSRKCDLGDLVVAHVTGRKVGGQLETEREERERVAAECYGCLGRVCPGQWPPQLLWSAQPRRRLQSIAMGRAGTSLFVYHKKAVYVIPHNTQPRSWAKRNQGEIPLKKKI